jgi:hypothetical protein
MGAKAKVILDVMDFIATRTRTREAKREFRLMLVGSAVSFV